MIRRGPLIAALLVPQPGDGSGFRINPDYKMRGIQFMLRRMGMKPQPGRFSSAQTIQTAGSLMLQCRGQGGNARIDIVAFLLPTALHRLISRLVKNELQIFWFVVVVIDVTLGVGSPGMLRCESEGAYQTTVGCIAGRKVFLLDPLLPEPHSLPIPRYLDWIARRAVDPGISNLLRNYWKDVAEGVNCGRHVG